MEQAVEDIFDQDNQPIEVQESTRLTEVQIRMICGKNVMIL